MSTNGPFAIVGLTGGIASGKTTVANMLEAHGVRVIDADALAREVVEPGEPALEEIRETFGNRVIDEDGRLDRQSLAEVVFEDEQARERLNAITHPRIARRMQQKAAEARESGEPWVVYDAALIVENGLEEAFAALVVVAADRETRVRRLVDRDDLEPEEARSRMDSQLPLSEKIAVADWVIDNNGTLEETRRQVDRLFEILQTGLRETGSADRENLVEAGIAESDELA